MTGQLTIRGSKINHPTPTGQVPKPRHFIADTGGAKKNTFTHESIFPNYSCNRGGGVRVRPRRSSSEARCPRDDSRPTVPPNGKHPRFNGVWSALGQRALAAWPPRTRRLVPPARSCLKIGRALRARLGRLAAVDSQARPSSAKLPQDRACSPSAPWPPRRGGPPFHGNPKPQRLAALALKG